jgi:cytidyltransferase-like protein
MRCLFSGRFDPPHPGHIASILRLADKYDEVVVMMLDYPDRNFPIEYCGKVFSECIEREKVKISVNKTHFGKISLEEWELFQCDLYAGGNLSVLRHVEKLGIKVHYLERAFEYSASKYERLLAFNEK